MLVDPEHARHLVLERVVPLEGEDVPLEDALGRVLAADVSSADDIPAFANSAMDGFAIRAADTAAAPAILSLVGESRAGHPAASPVGPGQAIRIATGAMLPAGADAVVRLEEAIEADGRVEVRAAVEPGTDVRRAGEDVRRGERVLERGTPLGPAELGVLASVGVGAARCARRPRVAVLTTGDELRSPTEPLGPGGVRDSSRFTVSAQARQAGAEVTPSGPVPDDAVATARAVERALDADVAVICGGMSVGPHDHVKAALAGLGVDEVFFGVALRPGKPTWFGVRHGDGAPGRTLVFGLPGNPVSAMVTFRLFALPALRALQGAWGATGRVRATIDEDYPKPPGRAHAVRCRADLRDDGWHVRPTGDQGSHVLTSMLGAEALAMVEAERGDVRAGEAVWIEPLPAMALARGPRDEDVDPTAREAPSRSG